MSMEEFMDAHINHGSTRNNMPVMKLHQGSSNFSERDWNETLSTVSAPKIEGHAETFRSPDNVYISMIVAYPTKWTDKLPALSDLPRDTSGVQQVVTNIGDYNFGDIFPREHVEFIDRLKNVGKRSAKTDDDDGEDRTKKQRGRSSQVSNDE
ncbi:hypothetical protein BGZ93_000347 [Podila epicladia]|nr:hypothetical protein BGZ93_000347 [Podila epicladia]